MRSDGKPDHAEALRLSVLLGRLVVRPEDDLGRVNLGRCYLETRDTAKHLEAEWEQAAALAESRKRERDLAKNDADVYMRQADRLLGERDKARALLGPAIALLKMAYPRVGAVGGGWFDRRDAALAAFDKETT